MCVKMFAALALLPANLIEEGYQCIRQHARNNNLQLTPFFNYFNSFWLRIVGPETFSVHGIARRTNNNVENFHGRLKEKFQTSHPNLWTFLKHLNELSLKNHITIAQLSQGQKVSRPVKIKYIANSERIKIATAQLNLGTINVSDFLIQCSYTAETYIREELNWYTLVEPNLIVDNDDLTQSDGDDSVSVAEDIPHPVVNFDDLTQSDGDDRVSVAEDIPHPVVNFAHPTQYDGDDSVSGTEDNNQVAVDSDGNEDDFILEEELDPDMVNMMEIDNRRREVELQNIPFVQVPINLPLPPNSNICVVCKDLERTHALIPCGHKALCGNCAELLHPKRCPLCKANFSSTLRIWS
ncbi:uncharacterized protein LOC107883608 isoform X2 [Acyrthosiphon pisum]|uniref:RING-type domain-containing protein n=1 Tax=Acyrthosiphon pisum TaxID=7029 RepID=A0A8R2JLP7_ACYPI|nr:uncharacterized protein LOC107883608 isoform X2 [Acyrthosiphon pisum]